MSKSRLDKIPAGALILATVFISFIFYFLLDDETSSYSTLYLIIIAILFAIFNTVACFLICRAHPDSVWFTPIICSSHILSSYFFAWPFWTRLLWIWIILGSGVVLMVIGSIVGARIGRRLFKQNT